jgi:hypothetical protein
MTYHPGYDSTNSYNVKELETTTKRRQAEAGLGAGQDANPGRAVTQPIGTEKGARS